MKIIHTKHDLEQFAYAIKDVGKIIGMSDEKVLEHFKEVFPPKIEAQLIEIDDIDM